MDGKTYKYYSRKNGRVGFSIVGILAGFSWVGV